MFFNFVVKVDYKKKNIFLDPLLSTQLCNTISMRTFRVMYKYFRKVGKVYGIYFTIGIDLCGSLSIINIHLYSNRVKTNECKNIFINIFTLYLLIGNRRMLILGGGGYDLKVMIPWQLCLGISLTRCLPKDFNNWLVCLAIDKNSSKCSDNENSHKLLIRREPFFTE